jgi:hypothetical protein
MPRARVSRLGHDMEEIHKITDQTIMPTHHHTLRAFAIALTAIALSACSAVEKITGPLSEATPIEWNKLYNVANEGKHVAVSGALGLSDRIEVEGDKTNDLYLVAPVADMPNLILTIKVGDTPNTLHLPDVPDNGSFDSADAWVTASDKTRLTLDNKARVSGILTCFKDVTGMNKDGFCTMDVAKIEVSK